MDSCFQFIDLIAMIAFVQENWSLVTAVIAVLISLSYLIFKRSKRFRINYAKFLALSADRRDKSYMQAVFNRHKDVEGGLSKTALMAALREVEAPVLSSSEGASEDELFSRADSNLSGAVDLNECVSPSFDAFVECRKFAFINGAFRRFMIVASLPDELELFLSHHNLSVSAATSSHLQNI
jgi:hypothetical protein